MSRLLHSFGDAGVNLPKCSANCSLLNISSVCVWTEPSQILLAHCEKKKNRNKNRLKFSKLSGCTIKTKQKSHSTLNKNKIILYLVYLKANFCGGQTTLCDWASPFYTIQDTQWIGLNYGVQNKRRDA